MFLNLTIIILTHNRDQYLERILDYYSDIEYTVLIADSSQKSYSKHISSNINYHHFSNMDFSNKLNEIMQLVETKYMLFCADDDFWVKESMAPCINFLDKNLDYSSIQGNYIGFSGYTENDFIPAYLHAQSIESDTIEKRLSLCMENYMPLFYALHRTPIVKKIFSDNYTTNISHAILNEVSVSLYSLTFGKHKKMDILTYVRDDMSDPTPVQRDNLKEIASKDEFSDELNQFKLNLANLISSENNRLDVKRIVDSSLSIYINQVNDECLWKSIVKKYFYFLLPIIRYLRAKRNRKIIINKYFDEKGYPLSDRNAIDAWKNIQKVLQLYKV